ncbi:hypothetical protein [Mesorhizobium argentiipisi]|uniref:Transposase n=1 Tax=Mesorhizobium argentiipisi TaxID=3015175 RepID=A0ABU8KBA3_9HYPH
MAAMLHQIFPSQSIFRETFGRLDRRQSGRHMAGFFLATLGDLAGLHKEQSGFLFSDAVLPGGKAANC